MTGLIQDIRYALRALRRAPGFTAVSIVTLALGIAATTIVDGILLRPLPIADPDRVMLAREALDGGDMTGGPAAVPAADHGADRRSFCGAFGLDASNPPVIGASRRGGRIASAAACPIRSKPVRSS